MGSMRYGGGPWPWRVGASPSSTMVGGERNERHHKVTSMSMGEYMIVCDFYCGVREL